MHPTHAFCATIVYEAACFADPTGQETKTNHASPDLHMFLGGFLDRHYHYQVYDYTPSLVSVRILSLPPFISLRHISYYLLC